MAAAAAAFSAVLIAGCGGSAASPPAAALGPQGTSGTPAGTATAPQHPAGAQHPAAVITSMRAAVRAAHSVHLTGTLAGAGGRTVGLDVGLIRNGGFAGTVTESGLRLAITDAGGTVYVKATRAFLAQLHASAAVCSVMCGKYVAMSAAKGNALAGDLTMGQMLASLTGKLPAFSGAGYRVIDGQRARVLRGSDGSLLAVAAAGAPYPVEAISPRGRNGRLQFSQWDRVPPPSAPPPSQIISLSQLDT